MYRHLKYYLIISILMMLPFIGSAKTIIQYDITGINDPLLKNAQDMLKAAQQSVINPDGTAEPAAITRLFNQSVGVINTALQPYGYFSPIIRASMEQKKQKWTFRYIINPGPAVEIRQLDVQVTGAGATDPQFAQWQKTLPLKLGDVFNTPDFNKIKESFFSLAENQGYLNAQLVKHEIKINVDDLAAKISLKFETGSQYFYGPITFSKSKLSDNFLRRYLNIRQGEPFSIAQILKLQENLSDSGYFKKVTLEYNPKKAQQHIVPIHIELTPVDTMLYTIGAGYGTDTGYRGGLGWQWQLINSKGHHFSAQYNVSQIGNSTSLNYFIPGAKPLTEQYQLNITSANYNTNAGQSWLQSYGGQFNFTSGKWQTNYGLAYQFEKYDIPNLTPESVHLLMPTVTWTYLDTNQILKPTYGTRFSVNIRGAAEQIISDVSFTQTQITLRRLLPLDANNRLFFRTTFGATTTSDFNLVPLSLQFTAGGTQSIRGFSYQSLGPAQYLLTGSAQYEYRIHGNWFATVFHDAGNAFDSFSDMAIQQSDGIGVLWESPIGSMELDLAKATNFNGPIMLQFNVGSLL